MKRKILAFIMCSVLSIGSYSQEVMTVITDGLGKNIESATQRAAEAALTQVVGSFIDSTKMIEKRKEIRDGVKKQTKKISSKISEYSQGMIQSIEVLEVSDDDGFTRVTAKVSVRIEDFKNYIKQTVFAEKKVRKGLLSKIKIKKKQSKNLADLVVGKVLKDIISTQVMIPVIDGEIEEVTDLKIIEQMDKKVPGDGYVIFVPVKATINPSFLENATRILDETAEQKLEGTELSSDFFPGKGYKYSITLGDFIGVKSSDSHKYLISENNLMSLLTGAFKNTRVTNNLGMLAYMVKNPESMVTYIFPERSATKLCKATESLGRGNSLRGASHVPDIKMSFLSEDGVVLRKEVIRYKPNREGTEGRQSSSHSYVYGSTAQPASSSVLLTSLSKYGGAECLVFIDTESKYRILTKVTEEVLVKTDKIVISYSQSTKRTGWDVFK
jgi:hypothetical protein